MTEQCQICGMNEEGPLTELNIATRMGSIKTLACNECMNDYVNEDYDKLHAKLDAFYARKEWEEGFK